MSYNHLSIDERSCLQFYYVQGLSVRKISKLLNRSPSTISREIRRNCWQLVRGVFYYVAALVIKTLSALPKGAVKTITTDNGNEFALWENMERALDCEIYFTDTYCSWHLTIQLKSGNSLSSRAVAR